MSKASFASVWDALEDTPEAAENMRCRSKLMFALKEHIKATGLSQVEAASALGVTQPVSRILCAGRSIFLGWMLW
jgi:predicted XRE-type DNA-binding protein